MLLAFFAGRDDGGKGASTSPSAAGCLGRASRGSFSPDVAGASVPFTGAGCGGILRVLWARRGMVSRLHEDVTGALFLDALMLSRVPLNSCGCFLFVRNVFSLAL